MQEVKFLLREIGENAMSAAELEEYIAYNFTSKGYRLFNQSVFPVTDAGKIKSVQLFMTFTKDEETVGYDHIPETPESETTVTEAKKKVGRPAKSA